MGSVHPSVASGADNSSWMRGPIDKNSSWEEITGIILLRANLSWVIAACRAAPQRHILNPTESELQPFLNNTEASGKTNQIYASFTSEEDLCPGQKKPQQFVVLHIRA